MKKLKYVFIDIEDDRRRKVKGMGEFLPPYSTFQRYKFDKKINHRVSELFGWTTDLLKELTYSKYIINIHVITLDYLRKHGVSQHFYSPHGPKYDDKYSYLHGMNLLAFEGYNRVHLIYSIKRISQIIQEKRLTSSSKRKRFFQTIEDKNIKRFTPVPVDRPRIGILTLTSNLKVEWVERLRKYAKNVIISDDIRNLILDSDLDSFIDYSLSTSYPNTIEDYLKPLNSILETV